MYIYKSNCQGLLAKNLFTFLFCNCLLFKPNILPAKFAAFQRISVHIDKKKHSHFFLALLLQKKRKTTVQPPYFTSMSSSAACEYQ